MTGHDTPSTPRDQLAGLLKLAARVARHWRLGLAVLVAGAGLSVLVLQLLPKHYVSQTVLLYQQGIQWDLYEESSRQAGQRLRDTTLARGRLRKVIVDLGLYPKLVAAGRIEDAVDEMRRRTAFKINDGGTFTIEFSGESPREAQRATEQLAQLVIADHERQRADQFEVPKEFLDAQRKRNEEVLRQKQLQLAQFLAKHPELARAAAAGQPVRLARPAAAPAADPPARRTADDARRPTADAPRPAADAARPQGPPAPDPRPELVATERQAKVALEAARRDLAELRRRLTDRHPSVIAAAQAAQDAEEAHQRAVDAVNAAPAPEVPSPDAVRRSPSRPQPTAAERKKATADLVAIQTEYSRLTREVEEELNRVQKLDTKQFVASMAASSVTSGHAAKITVIDPAFLPVRPSGARRLVLLLAGVAMSVLLGLGIALASAVLDDRVYDRTDLDRLNAVPVLAEIAPLGPPDGTLSAHRREPRLNGRAPRPALPPGRNGAGSSLVAVPASWQPEPDDDGAEEAATAATDAVTRTAALLEAPDSETAASFRVLRHRIAERGAPKTILVTSASVGEGKTTCALNLALAMCEGTRDRVLLLDAHLRRPALARILAEQRRRWTTKPAAAAFDVAEPWPVVEHVSSSLDFAPTVPDAPSRLLDAASMKSRLAQLGTEYGSIVIDGPPVLGSADVNLIQESVDGVLLTAWSHRSRSSSLKRAIDQIGSSKVLGVVVLRS